MKKTLRLLFIGVLASSILFSTTTAYGVVTTESKDTTLSVTFSKTGTPIIIDPTNPNKPLTPTPTDPITPVTGLAISYASPFTFAPQTLIGTWDYLSSQKLAFIQVTDYRNDFAGWKVEAKLSPFEKSSAPSLDGAELQLKGGTSGSVAKNPAQTISIDQAIALTSDNVSKPIASAAVDNGTGDWTIGWIATDYDDDDVTINDKVILHVNPSNIVEGTHTATLTWLLSNTP